MTLQRHAVASAADRRSRADYANVCATQTKILCASDEQRRVLRRRFLAINDGHLTTLVDDLVDAILRELRCVE